jgi:hypothetical protein
MLEGAAASISVTIAFMKLHEPIFRATDGKFGTSLCEKLYCHYTTIAAVSITAKQQSF